MQDVFHYLFDIVVFLQSFFFEAEKIITLKKKEAKKSETKK